MFKYLLLIIASIAITCHGAPPPIVGVTSTNGTIIINPPTGHGLVDLEISGDQIGSNTVFLAGSNISLSILGGATNTNTVSLSPTVTNLTSITSKSFIGNGGSLTNLGLARTNTIWVAANGNDTNQGTSVNFPLATVSAAITLLTTLGGGKINVEAGTYTEVDGIHFNNISIEGAGIGATTIQSPMATNSLFYADSGACWFGRFTIQSTAPAEANWAAFHVGSSSNAQVTFNQMMVTNATCAVDTHTGTTAQFSLLIDDCQIYTTNAFSSQNSGSIQLSAHNAGTNSPCTIQNCIISNLISTASTNTCNAILNQSCNLTLNNCQLFAVNPSTGGSWSLFSGANGGPTIASNWVSGNVFAAPIGLYTATGPDVRLLVSNNINGFLISNFNGTVLYDSGTYNSLTASNYVGLPIGSSSQEGILQVDNITTVVTNGVISALPSGIPTLNGIGTNLSLASYLSTLPIPALSLAGPCAIGSGLINVNPTGTTSTRNWILVTNGTPANIFKADDVGDLTIAGSLTASNIYGNNLSGQSVVVTSGGQLGVSATNINLGGATSGQVLAFDGTEYAPTSNGGGLTNTFNNSTNASIAGTTSGVTNTSTKYGTCVVVSTAGTYSNFDSGGNWLYTNSSVAGQEEWPVGPGSGVKSITGGITSCKIIFQ